jgi:hypothetical protein
LCCAIDESIWLLHLRHGGSISTLLRGLKNEGLTGLKLATAREEPRSTETYLSRPRHQLSVIDLRTR